MLIIQLVLVHFFVKLAYVFIFDSFTHANCHLFFIKVVIQWLYEPIYELIILKIYLFDFMYLFFREFFHFDFVLSIQVVIEQDKTDSLMNCFTLCHVC